MNKMKCSLTMATIAISAMFLVSSGYAQVPATVNIYAWTDKPNYDLGERSILHIVIRNDRTDEDLILQNMTITYPWFVYTGEKWDGNDTIKPSPLFVLSRNGGNVYTITREFTVPSDGRAISGMSAGMLQINIEIAVDKSPYHYPKSVPIYVKNMPLFMSIENADKIITLFTIQVVLLIVCTIILAATIFLSARRPQITWRKEEKPE